MNTAIQAPVIPLKDEYTQKAKIQLFIKREDLIHPWISGNKWRKLKYNLIKAKEDQAKTLITFGGAYSNHLLAVAAAAAENGFSSIGIVRGEETLPLNPTLKQASENFGMQLHFVARSNYRELGEIDLIDQLEISRKNAYILPEGGTNSLAIKGCEEIIDDLVEQYDYICCSIGTGGTIAGLICSKPASTRILGFSSLKGNFLDKEIKRLIGHYRPDLTPIWTLLDRYHFGGYAKFNEELIKFVNSFKNRYNIPLDPVYTGKMMYGLYDLIKAGYFEKNVKILAIHTGGIQGIRGFNERFGNLLDV